MPYVLTIREKGNSWAGRGPLVTIHGTREEAESSLLEWVKENWQAEMDEDLQTDKDPDDLVREYFDFVLQGYEIAEAVDLRSAEPQRTGARQG